VGLGWGLRHEPHEDERVFVENVQQMAERGDLDHRYYEYPGLVFYLLRPALALAPPRVGPYLAARAVVALFGVLGCAAVYLLGRALAGPAVGLVGALLMAVSPVAVHTAHMVRPDVVLQVFVTLALLALLRVGDRPSRDLAAGAAIGLAAAVKFSGAFLVPSYLLRRALAPGPRLRGALLAAAAAALVFVLTTPYAVLHAPEFAAGVQTQVGYHYEEAEGASPSPLGMAPAYVLAWPRALGLPAILFALAGAVAVVRWDARRWVPLLALPVVTLAVMGSQRFLFTRHLLPSLGVLALLAALTAEGLARPASRRLGVPRGPVSAVLVLILAVPPLARSVEYVRDIARPGTRDRALDWARAQVPDGARVLSTVERLGLDAGRVELTVLARLLPEDRPLALEMDYVLATTADDGRALSGLVEQARFEPASAVAGPAIRALFVPPALRPVYRALAVTPGMLAASENAAEVGRACDGDLDTLWRTLDPQRPGDWLAVALAEPAVLARIELHLGVHRRFGARELQVAVSADGHAWRDVRSRPARPPLDRQSAPAGPGSQVLVLTPAMRTRFVRVGLRRSGANRWGVAELRLFAAP
jgi:4-amino-4-deoxy-L-arabinose transferase-like glycosyltransferase